MYTVHARGRFMIHALALVLALVLALLCSGCGQKTEKRDAQAIIEEMVVDYGSYGGEAETHIAGLLKELRAADADAAARWESISSIYNAYLTAPKSIFVPF